MNECIEHEYAPIDEHDPELWWISRRICIHCEHKKVYLIMEDQASLAEIVCKDLNNPDVVLEIVPSKDKWCEFCVTILVKPFITVDDKEMCKECAKEYNQYWGW